MRASLPMVFLASAALTTTGGCKRETAVPTPPAVHPAPNAGAPEEMKTMTEQAQAPADTVVIRGEGFFLQRIAIPPDSTFSASLRTVSVVGAPIGEPLATDKRTVSAGPPYPFELRTKAPEASTPSRWGVFLALDAPDGTRWFEQAVVLAPGQTELGEVKLRSHRSEQPTPTERAAARGSVLWGVGQEPGWSIELGDGERPALHATLEYGQRHVEVEHLEAKGANAFEGVTSEGATVSVRIDPQPCTDSMSGETFEVGVELTVGRETFRGCANRIAK